MECSRVQRDVLFRAKLGTCLARIALWLIKTFFVDSLRILKNNKATVDSNKKLLIYKTNMTDVCFA